MKKILSLFIILISLWSMSLAQSRLNLGVGYFGHTITHPGGVLEFEIEKMYTGKASIPFRMNLGFFSHNRNHDGLFLDLNVGFRRYYRSGLFLEESIGVGVLEPRLNSDGVYEVSDAGEVSESSRWMEPDLMPSLTLGAGYNLTKNKDNATLIWIRPKIYWQYPHKTSSTFNPVLQLGFSWTLPD